MAEILPYLAVIDCGGVGYACKTTNTTLAQLKKGQRGKLYTYLDVGENAFGLYGFATANELNSFKLLIGVSGVGPKAALAILSAATPESLAMAIVTGDEKSLTAAPGVGKKIAQRIILELKDKMARESAATGLDFSGGAAVSVPAFTNKATEAAQALAVLGYTSAEVAQALKGVDVESSVPGGDHPPVPEKDGEVSMKILSVIWLLAALAMAFLAMIFGTRFAALLNKGQQRHGLPEKERRSAQPQRRGVRPVPVRGVRPQPGWRCICSRRADRPGRDFGDTFRAHEEVNP